MRGRFTRFDYVAGDVTAAQRFFNQLFGWQTIQLAGGTGAGQGQSMIVADGMPIGSYEQGAPGWLAHIEVDDAHDAAAKVKRLGGKMLREPVPMGELGKVGIAVDPTGVQFGLYQPFRTSISAGPVCWSELYTTSPTAAVTFFKQLCGFTEQKSQMADGTYHMFERDGEARGGARKPIPGMPAGWFAWVRVPDVATTVAKAYTLGATIRMPPVGGRALLSDPFGVALGLVQ